MKKNIVWLASYPKSGNTWFRIFISNLRSNQKEPIDINKIETNGIFSSNGIFEKATGISPMYLTDDEADMLRADVFRYYSNYADDLLFVKIHDAYTRLTNGEPLIPLDVTFKTIYLIRNPFDVAVSFSFHDSKSIKKGVSRLNTNRTYGKSKSRYRPQIRQKLLTWKEHVDSWTKKHETPTLVLRYEDMKQEPLKTFSKAVQFLELDYTEEEIQEALNKSSFKQLQSQEETKGFKESRLKQKAFFRKEIVGDWRNHLTEAQADMIKEYNRDVLEEFGYLSGNKLLV